MKSPLIGHACCLNSPPQHLEAFLSSLILDPQVSALSDGSDSDGGWVSSLDAGNVRAGYLAFGEPVTLRLWNTDFFGCVLPLRGRARLEQYPGAMRGQNGPFFLLPKSDQQWQLSGDCELMVVRVSVDSTADARIRELLDQPRDRAGRNECAQVMMESLPYRLHHGRSYADKLRLLQDVRKEFLQLFGFYPEPPGMAAGPQVMDPRVLRAMDYLLQLSSGEYDLDAVCDVAHMSARGLYYTFERHLGCTPYAYFRACHLIRVRLALLSDTDRNHSIAWHASNYGFQHMGRLAARYRHQFGELPSETYNCLERDLTCV